MNRKDSRHGVDENSKSIRFIDEPETIGLTDGLDTWICASELIQLQGENCLFRFIQAPPSTIARDLLD